MQKERLFQGTEELLVWTRLFDSLEIELCASPDDELGISSGADRGCKAHEIAAMPERTPCMKIAREKEEGIRAIQEVGRICAVGLFSLDKFLSRDDSQLFIQHFHGKVQILHGGNNGPEHPSAVRGVKCSRLCSPDLELARFR